MRVYHFIDQKYGLDDLQKRRLKVALIGDLNDPFEFEIASPQRHVRHAFRSTKNHLAGIMGLLCFSKNWKNPVQWAHYADRHRGMCLGFDIPDELLTPVEYRSKLLKPDMRVMESGGDERWEFYKKVLSTKYVHWRYENEVRLFVQLQEEDKKLPGFYFKPFDDEIALREVVIGHRSTVTRSDLLSILGENAGTISICKARLAFRSYTVVKQRDQSLW